MKNENEIRKSIFVFRETMWWAAYKHITYYDRVYCKTKVFKEVHSNRWMIEIHIWFSLLREIALIFRLFHNETTLCDIDHITFSRKLFFFEFGNCGKFHIFVAICHFCWNLNYSREENYSRTEIIWGNTGKYVFIHLYSQLGIRIY